MKHAIIAYPNTFTSSFLFLLCSYLKRNTKYSFGMFATFLTSILYHGTGNMIFRKVDLHMNIIIAIYYTILLLKSSQFLPIFFLGIATIGYKKKWDHIYFVHIPVALGFLSII